MAEHLTAAQGHALVERYGDPLTALVGVSAVGVGGTDTGATVQVFYDTTDLDALEGLYAIKRGWRGRIDATGRVCHGAPHRKRSMLRGLDIEDTSASLSEDYLRATFPDAITTVDIQS